ncbi:hypothetical protein [Leptospirillum ferriphilum]|nr:hypothetical protein [Leptospirillum ferriphilum]
MLGRRAPDRSSPAFGTAPVGRVRPELALPGIFGEKQIFTWGEVLS